MAPEADVEIGDVAGFPAGDGEPTVDVADESGVELAVWWATAQAVNIPATPAAPSARTTRRGFHKRHLSMNR